MKKWKKLSNYKKNAIVLISSFGVILLLGSSLGVFANMFSTNSINNGDTTPTKNSILPRVSSLESYWDNLKTESLLDGKTSLSNFVNENGAVFQNLIASKKYEATAALNQLVSTPKQLDLNANAQNTQSIKERVKTSIRRDASEFYDFLSKPVESADEFIARINLAKKVYPTFYESFVRGRAQNYGVWVKEDYMNSSDFGKELPVVGENDERYFDSLFLKNNYKNVIIDKSLGAYASTLYNFLLVSSVQQMGSLTKLTAPITGGIEGELGKTIKAHRAYINARYLSSIILYGNEKKDVRAFARSLFDQGLKQNAYHNDEKRHWYDMVACASFLGWLFCGPAAALAAPSRVPYQTSYGSDRNWITNSHFNLNKIVEYGTYPILSNKSSLGVDKSNDRVALLPDTDSSLATGLRSSDYSSARDWVVSLHNQSNDGTNNSWSWNAETVWGKTEENINKLDGFQSRRKGMSQAKADLEYLSNVYFDKISKEWKEEAESVKNGDDRIYFYGAFSQGDNSFVDMMENEFKESLFNVAMREYWLELSSELKKAVVKIGRYKRLVNRGSTSRLKYTNIDRLDDRWLTKSRRSWGGNNDRKAELDDLDKFVSKVYDGVQHLLSEKNRIAIFKKHLDNVWNRNKTTYETAIRNKLLETKKNAQDELDKAKTVYKKYLIDAYNEENFRIIDPVTDNLNQKSIPSKVGDKTVNFGIIPIGNLGISPDGVDDRAEDVLDSFLTKNVVLSTLLEKEAGIGALLAERSVVVQREYINSLFATLQTGILPYLNTLFDEFANQNHNLWDGYLELVQKGADKELSPYEVESYYSLVLAQKSTILSKLLQVNIKSVSLAEGFLLDVLEVPRFNDDTKTLQTIFEMIEKSETLREYLINTSTTLLSA